MTTAIKQIGHHTWLLGPLAICFSSILVVAHATMHPFAIAGVVLFFAGVIAAYTLDHWMDHPDQRSRFLGVTTGLAIFIGLGAALWLPGWKIAVALALGVISLAYRRCKQWPLVKTFLVAGAWTTASMAFPVDWNTREIAPAALIIALFATFAANALLCDLKDGVADTRTGVRSAMVLWGEPAATALAAALAMTGVLAALAAHRLGLAGAGLMLCALTIFPRWISRPILGPALADSALVLPAVFILMSRA